MRKLMGSRRLRATVGAAALVAAVLALGDTGAGAGSELNVNACSQNATGTFTDILLDVSGTASGDSAEVSLTGVTVATSFSAATIVAGYNLGLLSEGRNDIPAEATFTIEAPNTAEGIQTVGPVETSGSTTITDPDGIPGTGDESGTDLSVSVDMPDTSWTPEGDEKIEFFDGRSTFTAAVGPGGLIKVTFTCRGAGTTSTPDGCATDPDEDCTGFTPDPRPEGQGKPFESFTPAAGGSTTSTSTPPSTTTTTSTSDTTTTTSTSDTTTTAPPTTTAAPTTTASQGDSLAHTGPAGPVESALLVVAGIVLLDLGYLVFTAGRPARRRRMI